MAAGTGQRMRPVSDTIPKPLIKVNGVGMIDSIIEAMHNNGITEIYVVVGYLAEKFRHLEEQYGVTLIHNNFYNRANNISSLYVARDHLENCLITDGDILVSKDDVYAIEAEKSEYSTVWTDDPSNEWIVKENDGRIVFCDKNGGKAGWQLFSISRWNSDDGKKLKRWVEEEFEINKQYNLYWDDIPLFIHLDDLNLGIRPIKRDSFTEIDDFKDLVRIDKSYSSFC